MLKKQRFKCLTGIPIFVALIFAALILGCSGNEGDGKLLKTTTAKPLAVNVFKVKRETKFAKTLAYFGKLVPSRQNRIRFRMAGTVESVFKKVGDAVDAGELLAELDLTELKRQREELKQSIASLEQSSQSQFNTEQLNELRAQSNRVQQELALGTIVAPYDCIVSSLDVNAGDIVSPQSPALRVIENAPPLVEADIPTEIANGLSVGQSVWISFENQVLKWKIRTKSPTVSAVGNRRLTLEMIDAAENVAATLVGHAVKIEFLFEEDAEGFWVPKSALVGKSDGLWAILVVEALDTGQKIETAQDANPRSSTVSQRLATIVSMDRDRVFIQATLSDSETVIANGTHRVVPGQRVITHDVTPSLVESVGGNVQ